VRATQEHLFELLTLRATEGLEDAESAELNELLTQTPEADSTGFELAAAAVHLALIGPERPMPAGLRARILADWQSTQAPEEAPRQTHGEAADSVGSHTQYGWLAAAAALAIALIGWWPRLMEPAPSPAPAAVVESTDPVAAPSVAELRDALLAAPETLTLPWATTEDKASVAASGDVVWNGNEQSGFMRIRGLEANDSTATQYQLWIFDRQRDERYPVDGGVFDVPASGEAIVAIDAKVRVGEAYLFAVTVEKPGGAVVSDRERIVLLAQG
jgi:hypothetical protein